MPKTRGSWFHKKILVIFCIFLAGLDLVIFGQNEIIQIITPMVD
jgi:hypothetical protein